jgi:hypothetical protein
VVFLSGIEYVQVLYHLFIHALLFEIQLSRRKGWDPVIKKEGLGSSYQEGRVGIQLSRRKGWDLVIKKEGLGSSYQEGRVGI